MPRPPPVRPRRRRSRDGAPRRAPRPIARRRTSLPVRRSIPRWPRKGGPQGWAVARAWVVSVWPRRIIRWANRRVYPSKPRPRLLGPRVGLGALCEQPQRHVAQPARRTLERPVLQRPHVASKATEAVERHQRTPAAPLALDADRIAVTLCGVAVVADVDSFRAHGGMVAERRTTGLLARCWHGIAIMRNRLVSAANRRARVAEAQGRPRRQLFEGSDHRATCRYHPRAASPRRDGAPVR